MPNHQVPIAVKDRLKQELDRHTELVSLPLSKNLTHGRQHLVEAQTSCTSPESAPTKAVHTQVMLYNELVNPPRVGRPSHGNTPPAPKHVYIRKVPTSGLDLDSLEHLPEISTMRKRCKRKDCIGNAHIKCS
ncbi:hypothetical protein PoB_000484100 [Plakobranchus ocellatus]|uniref:Uncharacterized protein n=1 Tax=Plakobranchus ocellatus TaxID=259542 RepID=A0AAV3XST0_9GAST|nr:hypothetical protein PoB_000484100 [Plakobranchus ocellatus]